MPVSSGVVSSSAGGGDRGAMDREEPLPIAERWIKDAFGVMAVPGGFALRLVDMSRAKAVLGQLRAAGIHATFTHLIVRAAAVALARNPELHQLVCGYRRLRPAAVDIGLSMAGETNYAPVVVIPEADRTPLGEMIPRVNDAVRAAREKERRDLEELGRRGWWIPWGVLRRLLLRWMQSKFWYRRKLAGTFQVSCLSSVDMIGSLLFYTGSVLGAGGVRDRVVAVDGQAVVRPTVWLTVCVDHAAMDGRGAGKLLKAVKGVLEGEELAREAELAVREPGGRTDPPGQPPTERPAGAKATAAA
jgi:hypothetical protein